MDIRECTANKYNQSAFARLISTCEQFIIIVKREGYIYYTSKETGKKKKR